MPSKGIKFTDTVELKKVNILPQFIPAFFYVAVISLMYLELRDND